MKINLNFYFPTSLCSGLTSPHRCGTMSFSQLKRISQSGQDDTFMLSLLIKAFVMFVAFLLFQSNLYLVLA